MILLRDKSFGQVDSIRDYFEQEDTLTRVPLEFMKALEMFTFSGGRWVGHWLFDEAGSTIAELVKRGYAPQIALVGFDSNFATLAKVVGTNVANNFRTRFPTPESFAIHCLNKMITERAGGEVKYSTWFNTHKPIYTPKDYVGIFKTISMYFSGQFPKDCSDIWANIDIAYRTNNIDYFKKSTNISKPYICEVLANVLYGLTYSDIDFNTLNEYLW